MTGGYLLKVRAFWLIVGILYREMEIVRFLVLSEQQADMCDRC